MSAIGEKVDMIDAMISSIICNEELIRTMISKGDTATATAISRYNVERLSSVKESLAAIRKSDIAAQKTIALLRKKVSNNCYTLLTKYKLTRDLIFGVIAVLICGSLSS